MNNQTEIEETWKAISNLKTIEKELYNQIQNWTDADRESSEYEHTVKAYQAAGKAIWNLMDTAHHLRGAHSSEK